MGFYIVDEESVISGEESLFVYLDLISFVRDLNDLDSSIVLNLFFDENYNSVDLLSVENLYVFLELISFEVRDCSIILD